MRNRDPERLKESRTPSLNREWGTGLRGSLDEHKRKSRDRGKKKSEEGEGKRKGRMGSPAQYEVGEDEEMVSSSEANYTHDRRKGAAAEQEQEAAAAAGIPTRTTEAEHADNKPRTRRGPVCGSGGEGRGEGGAGTPGGVSAAGQLNHDLTGISSLEKQAEYRQPMCSDEDLGLSPKQNQNLTHDVTSMA